MIQEEDPQETRVKHELLVRRVDRAKSVVMVAAGIAPLVFAVNMMQGDEWLVGYLPQKCIEVCTFAVFTLLSVCPWLLNDITLDSWYAFLIFLECLSVSPLLVVRRRLVRLAFSILGRMLLISIFNLQMKKLVLGTALVTLSCMSTFLFSEHQEGFDSSVWEFAAFEAFIVGVVSLSVLAVAERLITVDVRRQVEKEADKSMLSALRTVLNTVCDVALELDSELRVADDAPALAALLFRNPSRSLRGRL